LAPLLTFAQRDDFRGDSIDIKKIALHVTPNLTQKNIQGDAVIYFSPKVNNVSTIRFDLLRMNITSLNCSPQNCTYIYNDSQIFIRFIAPLIKDSNYILSISYNGTPMQDASAWGGWYWNGNYAFNLGVGFKSIPHNLGRAWFPCIDNFKVKQAFDISISCPQNLKAVSNGILLSQIDSGGFSTFNYHLPQPIPCYLASCNIGPYVFLNDTLKSVDGRILISRIAAEAKDTVNVKLSFQKLKQTVSYFESLFGAYPFDVFGYSLVPFGSGAMEHATNIAFPLFAADGSLTYETLWAHELSHMWWGDNITCANAEEMWINEGWASYCERLFTEHFYGHAAYQKSIDDNHRYCLQFAHVRDSGYYALDNVPQQYTYGAHSYQKGCDMIYGLRNLDPTGFFTSCKNVQALKKFTAITTDTLLPYFSSSPCILNAAKLYFKNKDYVSNKLEEVKITPAGSSYFYESKVATYDISQFSSTCLPIQLDYMDSIFNDYRLMTKTISADGWYLQLQLPHNNFQTFFDMENIVPDANTSHYEIITSTGTKNFDNEICNVSISQVTDSALLYINRSWDYTGGSFANSGIQANSKGFWTVGGLSLNKLKGSIRFQYNGAVPSAISGFEGVDQGFITQSEDSLVLLYRDSYYAPWQIMSTAVKSAGSLTDKRGSFLVSVIKPGQYCIGQYNHKAIGINKTEAIRLIYVFPNPATNSVTISIPQDIVGAQIEIMNDQGRVIFNRHTADEKNTINTSAFAKGIYFIRVQNTAEVFYKKLIIY
jgi:hypothetical protein